MLVQYMRKLAANKIIEPKIAILLLRQLSITV